MKAQKIDGLLSEAIRYHNDGRSADAERLYRQLLAADPSHADGMYLLGVLLDQTGRHADAASLIEQAIARSPSNPLYHYGFANILLGRGDVAGAVPHYQRAIALQPDFAEAHANLGSALKALGDLTAAIAHYEQAAALRPRIPDIQNNLGEALRKQGNLARARECLKCAIMLKPDYAEAMINLGNVLADEGDIPAAITYYESAIRTKPDLAEAYNNLGHALQVLSGPSGAVEYYERALTLRPDYAEAHNNLGNALSDLRHPAEAMKHYRIALTLQPDFAEAHGNLGNLLLDLGRFDEAREQYETAIALAPRMTRHHRALQMLKRVNSDRTHLAASEKLAGDMSSLAIPEQIELHFALGEAYADIGRHERSFRHLMEGNSLKRRSIVYDETATLDSLDRIRSTFTADVINGGSGAGDPSPVPIFIVGMMRSGTSLMEQMLACHPGVHGAGELGLFPGLARDLTGAAGFPEAFPSGRELKVLGSRYVASLARLSEKPRVTDKLPGNFAFAGLIHMALPNARIIHMTRDPIDTCLSCFSLLFTENHPYCYDLRELGRYYRAYAALMEHWHRVLPPGVMLEVRYEDLVADVEGQLRRVLAHCGLEWNDACLDFHRADRPVRTASAVQVRQPIYRTSIGRWRPYETLLRPLIEELGLAGA